MMSARPEEIETQPAPLKEEIGPAEDYIYTLMVNLEINWEEAIAHFLSQGRVCTNPDCLKDIEQRLSEARHCSVPCRDHAYWLRKKRGDTRLRPGQLVEN